MKKRLICILCGIFGFSLSGLALDWQACLEYKFPEAPPKSWVLKDDGQGVYISDWKLPSAIPTKAELEAVESQAVAWYADRERAKKADFDNWSHEELKALVKVLLEEINILRQREGLAPRTGDQIKNAIKAKL